MDCPFCNISKPIIENKHWLVSFDKYPVTNGHSLIITKHHRKDYFECTKEEKISLISIIDELKEYLQKEFNPSGFNIGMNVGEESGQTILHTHVHIIPRYKGDTENPRGGVRGVIPSKQNYDE
ncbi:HIT family protein [Maribacter arcticus]|uniref:Diadenosine tetraphosphate (Ap4A) hydrolase n=1 Tax=Maribacter arcticus TaxID=561365 RepID=A0A1T5ECM8_9FLAO|nr:HIT family protein [Maribacter arcticus]SKB81653.1 Diadenosine tetraphosphate (Ap4A) hydrolase [Maribacter arcticus]